MGLPLTVHKFDLIWVIMDRLTKSSHFIPINTKYWVEKYMEIYIDRLLYLHGVPKTIISDRRSQFVTRFWEQLHASLGTHLIHSSAYHLQTDGQIEWVNQILEDMLTACIMEHQGSWDKNRPLVEFSYNNSYQESLKLAPFEVLYRWRRRTPLNWIEPRERVIIWTWHCRWSRSDGSSYSRQLESREVIPRELCKQEVLTLGVRGWKPPILEGFANEGCEQVWGERKVSTSLHQTISHPQEMWTCGLQAGLTTVVSRSSRHLPRVTTEEVLEGTRCCRITWSDTGRGTLDLPQASNQSPGSEGLCHKVKDNQVL
jgi:hypothetical protein